MSSDKESNLQITMHTKSIIASLALLTFPIVFSSDAMSGPLANFVGKNTGTVPQFQTLYVDCNHRDLKTSTANTKDSIRADFYKGSDLIATVAWKGTECGATEDQLYIMKSGIKFDSVILSTNGKNAFWPDEIGYSFQKDNTGNSTLASLLDKWDGSWGRDNYRVWCLSKQASDRSGKDGGCFPAIKFTRGKGKQAGLSNYSPPPPMLYYWMQIDCYDSSVSSSATNNLIKLQLWNGTTRVRGGAWNFTPKSCSATSYRDTSVSFNTPQFTHFTLATNGNNGYWIDRIFLQRAQLRSSSNGIQFFQKYEWSRNHDEKGYCLSTDASDSGRSWKGKMHDGKCWKTISFDLKTQKAKGSTR
jgi:hypothetical protein